MAIPTMITFVLVWLLLILSTVIFNAAMLLSGTGVWYADGASAGPYIRKFQPWEVGVTLRAGFINIERTIYVSTKVVAAFVWAILIVSSFWSLSMHTATLQQLGAMTIRDFGASAAPFLGGLLWLGEAVLVLVGAAFLVLLCTWLFDKKERANQKYVRRVLDEARKTKNSVPSEIVMFIDPPHDDEVGC